MILYYFVEQVMTMCRVQEWQLSLSFFFSYFPLMVSDAISCPLHNLKTICTIIMTLYSYVEQVLTMCRVQERQLSLSYFLSYFPLMVSVAISCPLHNLKTFLEYNHDTSQLCRTGHEDVSHIRMTTLIFILSELSSLHG